MIERQHKNRGHHQYGSSPEYADVTTGIEATIQKAQAFKRTAAALEKQAEGTSRLVSPISMIREGFQN
jgi:predicted nucleic acid-binding Zn ribbon protein